MKTLSTDMVTHIESEVMTLATCWRLTRRDGVVLGFTDHDQDLTVDGVLHRADTGYVPSAVETTDALSVDNLEVEGLLDDDRLRTQELRAGAFDFAACEVFQVNWANLTMGKLALKSGQLGEVTRQRESFSAEIRGPSHTMQRAIGEVLTPTCRANLGDSRCTVDIAALTVAGVVTAVSSRRVFSASARTENDGYFDYGLLAWTAGANNGGRQEIKTYVRTGGVFETLLQAGYDIAVGDTFTAYPGCDKRFETCSTKFSNVVNFQGEPHVPGQDELVRFGGQ